MLPWPKVTFYLNLYKSKRQLIIIKYRKKPLFFLKYKAVSITLTLIVDLVIKYFTLNLIPSTRQCVTDLDKLNLVQLGYGGSVLGSSDHSKK